MDPICKHDRYNFKSKTDIDRRVPKTKPKTKSKLKRKIITTAVASKEEEEEEDISIKDIDTDNLPNLLCNCAIYIHNSANHSILRAIAEGLGATVMSDINASTTHVVIQPKGDPKLLKLVKQASSKRITCASPQWLLDCYEKRKYYSATHYPYSMDKEAHILSLDNAETPPILDPFGTTYIDYDAQESRRSYGGQTNLDGFITRQVDTPNSDSPNTLHNQDGMNASFKSTAPYSPNDLDEQEEMAREFYYNSNGEASTFTTTNSASLEAQPETEEELQEKRNQAEERALKAKLVIQQRMSRLEKEPSRSKKAIQSGFGERLRIWYGEQTVRQEDSRKRRVVQSALGNQQQQNQRIASSSTSTRRQSAQQVKRPRM